MNERELHETFRMPPAEFGLMPFWFWNDDLTARELRRQIRAFHAKGCGGFIPSARIGLSHRIGYLTEEYFRLHRVACDEARRFGMKVVLYDEGNYPSGSAQGQVVAENPEYAARCLIALQRKIAGPANGFWRPNPGRALQDRLVCVVAARETAPDVLDPKSFRLLEADAHELVRYDLPRGDWRLVACWDVCSGGTIRGVFPEEEDGHASAPPAGDLMNPDAVACFLRLTHDRLYAHLEEFFGTTIVAMFTDEPSPMGRGPKRGPNPRPYTAGFLKDLQARWDEDVRQWLPALWLDCGPRTAEFRHVYERAVQDRIGCVFFGAQSLWCAAHGIALTGHPSEGNEMGALRYFQWPGQDIVWRYVEPARPESAIEGPQSCTAKAASSAAVLGRCRRSASEVLGAYGWRLTLDEAKWLFDWHLVRGNNTFFAHALFYSIRGRRAFESEPDLGVHNVWWPHFGLVANYVRRLCWLLTDGAPVCDVAVLTDPDHLAWTAARKLLENQIDFVYVDAQAVLRARLGKGGLAIGACRFRAVVCDPADIASVAVRRKLDAFRTAGGVVLDASAGTEPIVRALGRDVDWPNVPSLRVLHYRKAGREFYVLVNEGDQTLDGALSLRSAGALELWDPLDGSVRPWPARVECDRTHTRLHLERRQGLVLCVKPGRAASAETALPPVPGRVVAKIAGPWRAVAARGRAVRVPCPGDWARCKGWETFSGTLRFSTRFRLPSAALPPSAVAARKRQRDSLDPRPPTLVPCVFLDLGRVGDIAEVLVNGQPAGVRAWAPYVFDVGALYRRGVNTLEVRVTNSMANAYDGLQLASGLLGPVVLRGEV